MRIIVTSIISTILLTLGGVISGAPIIAIIIATSAAATVIPFFAYISEPSKAITNIDPKWLIDAKEKFINDKISTLEFEQILEKGFNGRLDQVTPAMITGTKEICTTHAIIGDCYYCQKKVRIDRHIPSATYSKVIPDAKDFPIEGLGFYA